MKLEGLLLKRAAAAKDKAEILRIFSEHFSSLLTSCPEDWEIFQSRYIAADEVRLEMPGGSLHYADGRFYRGGWDSDFQIVYHRDFCRDII